MFNYNFCAVRKLERVLYKFVAKRKTKDMKTSKKHHFVSKFYLAGFTSNGAKEGDIYCFDMHQKKVLQRNGYRVIEIYPGASQDIWGIPRKQKGLSKLRRGLEKLGLKGLNNKMNGDELDAITGALTGKLFLQNKAEVLGNFKRGAIIVPQK